MDKNTTVLLADDEEFFLETTVAMLEREGFRCLKADSGASAAACLDREKVDVAVVDHRMPGNLSLECVRRVRESHPEMPVIIITGYPSMATAIELLRASVFDYITKPINMDFLIGRIGEAAAFRRGHAPPISKSRICEALVEGARAGMCAISSAGEMLAANRSAADLLTVPLSLLEKARLDPLTSAAQARGGDSATGPAGTFEVPLLVPGGAGVDLSVTAQAFGSGQPVLTFEARVTGPMRGLSDAGPASRRSIRSILEVAGLGADGDNGEGGRSIALLLVGRDKLWVLHDGVASVPVNTAGASLRKPLRDLLNTLAQAGHGLGVTCRACCILTGQSGKGHARDALAVSGGKAVRPAEPDRPESTETAGRLERSLEPGKASPRTVLVVDDAPELLSLCKRYLERVGYGVVLASNGKEAVDLVRERPDSFHAVLMDINMPVMDGIQALPHIRAARPDVKVILSSGYEQGRNTTRLIETGEADHFLPKPFPLPLLRDVLRDLLAD